MAADHWLEHAVTLLSSWVFQAVVLTSLAMHLILVFLSGIRRRKAYGGCRIFLWLAYQVNNWAPTYVLGNLYIDTAPREKQLYAFWVPFLLLHLARPDNMSAYSMEDNALSGRVMLFFPFQSLGAILIVYRYIHTDSAAGTLRPASWIMLFLAIFKYGESARALRRGGLDSIRSSFKPTTRESEGDSVEDDEGRLLLAAHDMFDICKGAFTDHWVSKDIRERARRAAAFGWEHMREVVEMELSLMYDVMYTKAAMVHTWGGYGIRAVSPLLTAVALSLFWFRYRDQVSHTRDVNISYALLGTTLVLDVAWLLRAVGSTWAHAFFRGTRWRWVKYMVICRGRWKKIRRFVVCLNTSRLSVWELRIKKPSSYRAWSGIIGQHNLLRDCHDTKRRCSKLAKWIGLEESWNEHCYSGPGRGLDISRGVVVGVGDTLFRKIWSLIHEEKDDKKAEPRPYPSEISSHMMRKKLDLALGFDPEIEEVVLTWHISTEVFLRCAEEDCRVRAEAWPTATAEVIRAVSDYMLFLIAVRPGMIPGLKFRSLYEETRSHLNELWGESRTSHTPNVNEKKLASRLREKVDTLPGIILPDGTRCALKMLRRVNNTMVFMFDPKEPSEIEKKLDQLSPEELFSSQQLKIDKMLGLIFDVWVRLLIFASVRCSRDSHAKQLSRGGELTTIIWILTHHTDVFPERGG